ncbi:uncharacterized protein [Rutidosis leptorrhynchoides]|uniref:uncharacterized protein n=1 Tax=Rutidosis leptorrhynchoides TaxID=125765 RepID=UPI003A98CE5D
MAGDDTESSSRNPIDISSPYYLSSSDQPGQNFVGDNLLNDGNYSDWKNEMMNALFAKNKIGFVDGSIPKPSEGSKDLMNWQRCNAMVRGWLVNSMVKEIKNSVKYAATARDIWTDLDERFNKENAPRVYELRRTITTIHQENMTVSSYYTKLRGIWDEMQSANPIPTCTCNGCTCDLVKSINSMRDKEKLYDFLMGLNEEYNTIRSQILSMSPLPKLSAAFHMVNQDERQRIVGNSRITSNDAAAFQASGRNIRNQSKSNNQNWNMKDNREKGDDKICTRCKKTGHTIDGCFEIIGYPDWWTKKAKNQSSTKTTNTAEQLSSCKASPKKTMNAC